MVDVIKYDKAGKESGTLELNPAVFDVKVNHEAVKEYLLLQLSNRRRANPTTKTRSQVRGGGEKAVEAKGDRSSPCRNTLIAVVGWRRGRSWAYRKKLH